MAIPRVYADEPESEFDVDLFLHNGLSTEIAGSLAAGETPGVFGLHGDWGAGKTSFLRRVHHKLTNQLPGEGRAVGAEGYDNVVVVWFEAWRYQHETTPIVALLNEIRQQLSWLAKSAEKLEKTVEVSIRAALMSLEDLSIKIGPWASIGVPKLATNAQKAGEDWERRHLSEALPTATVRDFLDMAISTLVSSSAKEYADHKPRLVVMIDDLDRCQPMVAYKLLETIKIFLNIKSCVFFLGINRREIERSIAIGLSEESGINEDSESEIIRCRAHEYLEKLCGHIWPLPFPNKDESVGYLGQLLGTDSDCKAAIIALHANAKHSFLPSNPRRIKSLANAILVLLRRGGDDPPEAADAILITIAAHLMVFHPEIHRYLSGDPDFFGVLTAWAHGESSLPLPTTHPALQARLPDPNKIDYEQKGRKATPGQDGSTPAYQFPDPADVGVLRIQPLLVENRTNITGKQLAPYLRVPLV